MQGSKNMTLFPDLFAVEIYNMSDEDMGALTNSGKISIFGETGGLLCSGEVDDMYTKQNGPNRVTTISVSDGRAFWRSKVFVTFSGGAMASQVLHSMTTGVRLGSITADDVKFMRGQTYTGRLADCVAMLAKSMHGRAYVTNESLFITAKGRSAEVVSLNEEDVVLDQDSATGARIIKTTIKGFPVGALVEIGNAKYRLVSQKIDADNFGVAWDAYLILINDSEFEME